jgi:hypothetical protein
MKDSEVISAAQALIDTPDKWMQNGYCDKTSGHGKPNSFCIEGAVRYVLGILPGHRSPEDAKLHEDPTEFQKVMVHHDQLMLSISKVAEEMFSTPVDMPRDVNDAVTTTHADVMALMDKSRALLEEQGR